MTPAVLRELLALTALPPPCDDVDQLLATFAAMYEARQRVIEAAPGQAADTDEARVLIAELAARDAAWASALAIALDAVGAARRNSARLRSYAR